MFLFKKKDNILMVEFMELARKSSGFKQIQDLSSKSLHEF